MKRVPIGKTTQYLGQKVKVAGWVNAVRSHGKIIFIDLRDRSGVLQMVFNQENKDLLESAQDLRPEWVIKVKGEIQKRPPKMVNPELKTGEVELVPKKLEILSEAKTPPFPLDTKGYKINEKKRLKYRYLDLRRSRMQRNLELGQQLNRAMRDFLVKRDFLEVQTPILTKSTPEGARDFIVPSRLQPGKFYALPQSPQQYKQLLMVAGIEKYFQIARCFRDEDPRADRAYGEFTQLDLEMSFVTQEQILDLAQQLLVKVVKKVFPEKEIKEVPFPRLSHKEVLQKYGTDKPDLRNNKNDPDQLAFCFIVDWPLFKKTKEKEISPAHHPFTAPKKQDLPLLDKKPMKVKSWQQDLVLNGFEIGGGSIRITDPKIQSKVFEILGYTKPEIERKFGHLLEAFNFGVPPHGGIALGLERLLMVVLGEPSIREVMAFPASASGKTAVMDAPSKVRKKQLENLNLKIVKKPKNNREV